MKTSIRAGALRHPLPLTLAFAIAAASLACAGAHAADLGPITISAAAAEVVGRDSMTDAPIEKVRVTAAVRFDAATLATRSGVTQLKGDVRAAALEACESPAFISQDTVSCVNRAVLSAQPGIDAAIARSRSTPNG